MLRSMSMAVPAQNMAKITDKVALEIQAAAKLFVLDEAKAQVAAGKPASGMSKGRHAAFVAKTLAEMVDSFALGQEDSPSATQVMQVVLLGTSLLNQSQLRQDLEKAGVFKVATLNTDEYGV